MLDGLVPPLLIAIAAALLLWCRHVYLARHPRHQVRADLALGIALVCVTGILEISMGRPLTYRNGPVRFWVGEVNSDQNSQQVADPYTFTHVIHGAAFYGLTHVAMGPASVGLRVAVALTLEAMWEAYENTDTVINRYREATIALGYYGDSVLNSVADVLACLLGFALAARLRWWWTVSWVVATEIALAIMIRDNLTLNIVMLILPIEAIKRWQTGG
ncbi:MAG TPA: DUF2585 family protein [Vicinamibacterales bacterium]|nr:DUF2585 family protein [Vicinamibacterales bacterium]